MHFSKLKSEKIRKKFKLKEISSKINKFLFVHLIENSLSFDKSYLRTLMNLSLIDSSKSKLIKRCVLTGRTRSVKKEYSISRIAIRDMLRSGLIPGYRKAVW